MKKDKIMGCLFGMAYGDSLGAETEFLDIASILNQYPNGLHGLKGTPALVTDDSQMALALGEALMKTAKPYEPISLGKEIEAAFIRWYRSPNNNRAPGMTCLTSIEQLINGKIWQEASNIHSKGSGANMRVQPIALLPYNVTTQAKLAQFQSAITHGHPTGLAAADITAWTIADLASDGDISSLVNRAHDYAMSQRRIYHADWLGELWQRAMLFPTAEDFIAHGWDEIIGAIEKLQEALQTIDRENDPCLITGKGWVAEEAYTTALYCFLCYPDNPEKVIERAAISSGDSDTLACIAGSFAGAYKGFQAWPAAWENQIEYQNELKQISDYLAKL